MQIRLADKLKQSSVMLLNFYHGKYFWSFATTLVILSVVVLFVCLPGQDTRFNAAHQELSVLVKNIRNHYKVRPDYWGLNTSNAIKNNLVPVDMQHDDKIISAIGREIILGQDVNGNMVMPGQRNFMITIPNLSKAACIEMISRPFSQEEHLGLLKVSLLAADNLQEFEWGGKLSLPIEKKTAKEFCKNQNTISWIFE